MGRNKSEQRGRIECEEQAETVAEENLLKTKAKNPGSLRAAPSMAKIKRKRMKKVKKYGIIKWKPKKIKEKEKGTEVLCYVLEARNPQNPFSFMRTTMIIQDSEEKSKENFYERRQVMQRADKMFRNGEVQCPICGGLLRLHGTYERHVTDGEGERYDGWVAQGYCVECDRYHSIIPSFIKPYGQYSAAVVEGVISEYERTGDIKRSDCPASDSVIYRWIKQFKERGAQAVGWLLSTLYTMYEKHISVIAVQQEGILKQLDRLTERLLACNTKGIIGRANIILTKSNHGFV